MSGQVSMPRIFPRTVPVDAAVHTAARRAMGSAELRAIPDADERSRYLVRHQLRRARSFTPGGRIGSGMYST